MAVDLTDRIGGASSSLAFKAPCRVATTANITLSGLQTIDGVTLVEDDRVLVKNQSTQTQNGIYKARANRAWVRTLDFDGNSDVVKGTRVYVHSGDTAGGEYEVTTASPVVIDTSSITFSVTLASDLTQAVTDAEAAETGAVAAQGYAEEWAINPEDDAVSVAAGGDNSTTFSALHWAAKAADSATAAETAETNAETAETNAGNSASAASSSASAASDSADAAAISESNAAASFDAFDDIYLGSKASDPALDNDGDALVEGQLYWNSSSDALRVYDGASWGSYSATTGVTADEIVTLTNKTIGDQLDFTPVSAPSHTEGRVYYDSTAKTLTYYNDEADVSLNIGQENWIRVYNDSGSEITNGEAVYISGYDSGTDLPEIDLTDPTASASSRLAGVATHDIGNGEVGYITAFGQVNDIDTDGLTSGEVLWLDPATPGGYTDTRPNAPDYAVAVGVVVNVDASTGSIFVGSAVDNGGIERIASEVFNGTVIEDIDVEVTSNGSTITLSLEANGGGDLTLVFNSLPQVLDCTPADTVTLTAGSDASPQINYVYVLESTGNLTAATGGFPAAQHVPIATVLCQSASSLQTDGAMKVHTWNDHLAGSDLQGHISHINRWIRGQNATWQSGVALTPTAGAGTLDIATSAGVVLQLHENAMPAFDTSSGDVIYVVNDPDAAYTQVASLTQADGVDEDANGDALGGTQSDYYNLVIWGACSSVSGDSKLFCNLPNGFYANDNGSQASNDDAQTANYSIPEDFRGVGFLIARLTISESGGTYSVVNQVDLRGQEGTALAGGGATGGNEFADNVFRIQDDGDTTKELAFEVSGVTTATTRTLTVPDASGTILLAEAGDTLTAGFITDSYSGGTQSSGTYTPAPATGQENIQHIVNGGAFTLAPPASPCSVILQIINNGSAGAITTSGFDVVDGDSFDTTDTNAFMCFIAVTNDYSYLNIKAMQ